jgi:hypothetical protein
MWQVIRLVQGVRVADAVMADVAFDPVDVRRFSAVDHTIRAGHFRGCETLYVQRHTKDIEVIGSLSQIEDLTLRFITLPDLSILRALKRLHSL